jgi:hypothetical protein
LCSGEAVGWRPRGLRAAPPRVIRWGVGWKNWLVVGCVGGGNRILPMGIASPPISPPSALQVSLQVWPPHRIPTHQPPISPPSSFASSLASPSGVGWTCRHCTWPQKARVLALLLSSLPPANHPKGHAACLPQSLHTATSLPDTTWRSFLGTRAAPSTKVPNSGPPLIWSKSARGPVARARAIRSP